MTALFLKVFQIKHRIRAATAAAVMICLSGIAAVMLFSSVRDGARQDAYADVYSGAISGALPDTSGEVSSARTDQSSFFYIREWYRETDTFSFHFELSHSQLLARKVDCLGNDLIHRKP